MGRLPPPPSAPRGDEAEDLHGERIADPYRWLERESAETAAWTAAQNARTRAALDAVPERMPLAARVRELLGVGLLGVPRPSGQRVFFDRRSAGHLQSVLCVREAGRERVVVDPNALDAAGLVTLDWWYPSLDGGLVAYGLSRGGTEMSTLRVIEIATGRILRRRSRTPSDRRCRG